VILRFNELKKEGMKGLATKVVSENHQITQSPNRSMFWRLWRRSLTVKRPQAGLAIASVLVGAAVASMLLNLYGDVRRKMTQEFRAYGPNVVVAPAESAAAKTSGGTRGGAVAGLMDETATARLDSILAHMPGARVVPLLYAVTEIKSANPDSRLPSQNLVAAGANFAELRRLYPSWRLEGREPAPAKLEVIIGTRVAALLHVRAGDSVALGRLSTSDHDNAAPGETWRVSGVLSTGSSEDDQVFLPLAALQQFAGLEGTVSLVELSIPGDAPEVERSVHEINAALPGLDVRPIRQIVYSSGRVLGTIRWLTVSLMALILVIIALSVTATMTTIVLERQKDVAVMKSLGAGDGLVMRLFVSEGAAMGLAGGLAGFALGVALARQLAERLFHVGLSTTWWTLPAVALAGMALAAFATMIPVRMVRRVQPAAVLKGE
jgi:putative ABC transport system permease protein